MSFVFAGPSTSRSVCYSGAATGSDGRSEANTAAHHMAADRSAITLSVSSLLRTEPGQTSAKCLNLIALRPRALTAVVHLHDLLPGLVVRLSQVVGRDLRYAVVRPASETRRKERRGRWLCQHRCGTDELAPEADTLGMVRRSYQTQSAQATQELLALHADSPTAMQAKAGAWFGQPRQWLSSS
jgi:hypothetical protein